jgi:hypothetical protein
MMGISLGAASRYVLRVDLSVGKFLGAAGVAEAVYNILVGLPGRRFDMPSVMRIRPSCLPGRAALVGFHSWLPKV